jgi:hypothetical protein
VWWGGAWTASLQARSRLALRRNCGEPSLSQPLGVAFEATKNAENVKAAHTVNLVTKSDLKETEFRLDAKIESVEVEIALVKWMIVSALALLSTVALKLFSH